MSRRDVRLYLNEIVEACDKVARYIEGMDAEAFYQAELYQDAVVRNLEIIGEAGGLLIELAQPLGLAFVDLAFSLEETLGRKVDLATFDSVRRTIQKPRWQALAASIAEDLIDVETIHLLPDQF